MVDAAKERGVRTRIQNEFARKRNTIDTCIIYSPRLSYPCLGRIKEHPPRLYVMDPCASKNISYP